MIHRRLKAWRKQIPAMTCIPGCRECCEGYAPAMLLSEWREIAHPAKAVKTMRLFAGCPFLGESGCGIYARRPLVCRIFGTVSRAELEQAQVATTLPVFCPRGCEPETPLAAGAALGLQVNYQRLLNQELLRVVEDFQAWIKGVQAGKPAPPETPPKFQWLFYVLCTQDGQNNLRQVAGRGPALNPGEMGRLAALMGG